MAVRPRSSKHKTCTGETDTLLPQFLKEMNVNNMHNFNHK